MRTEDMMMNSVRGYPLNISIADDVRTFTEFGYAANR